MHKICLTVDLIDGMKVVENAVELLLQTNVNLFAVATFHRERQRLEDLLLNSLSPLS